MIPPASALKNRDMWARPSKALWIPIIWLFIAGSRPVSLWLDLRAGDLTDRNIEGSPFDRNLFTALIVAALVVLVARGWKQVGPLLRTNGPILLFIVYCGISICWSDFSDVAFKRWIRAVGDVAMVLVVLTDAVPRAAVRAFLERTSVVLLPASILFDLWRGGVGRQYHFGLTQNKNMFGAISMVLGLGALWRLFGILQSGERKGRRKKLIVQGSIVAMAMWCLWTANSTTSTSCFLLGSILIVVTSKWQFARKPLVVHLIVASLVFLALYASILNPDVGIVSTMGKDSTLTGRTDVWQAVLSIAPSPWFGAGFESFWLGSRLRYLWNIFPWNPNEAHNGYIEVYLNLGWTGVVLLAVAILMGYRRVVGGLRRNPDINNLMLAYLVVAVVYSLTEAGFRIFSPSWLALLLSIIGVFTLRREDRSVQPLISPSSDSPETWDTDHSPAAMTSEHPTRASSLRGNVGVLQTRES